MSIRSQVNKTNQNNYPIQRKTTSNSGIALRVSNLPPLDEAASNDDPVRSAQQQVAKLCMSLFP
ncbi:hypothetical protein [Fangia hongkongensis]|uniref:hypothetical protein n=1 Tax=Fangia hongkongensis TaxID=270495 RepID=UPI00036E9CA6|nr:hypothetical protein [Fangia hongkongensis]MBK2125288.1 hypothetical protein [Fangia hongkongensis]